MGAVASLVVAAIAPAGAARATRSVWATYGGSFARDSAQSTGAPAPLLRAAWTWQDPSGVVLGEPLIAGGRVYVATEADVVVALSAATGRRLWSVEVGTPVPSGDLPCGDISPTVGVTSTMVLDRSRSRLFVSAETLERNTVHHLLLALSPRTGSVLFRRDIDLGWSPQNQLQRAALALDRGRVLVGFGGNFGDCGSYRGYLISIAESGRGPLGVFRTPTQRGDAIWAPAGVAVDGSGDIYLATGNGASRSSFDMGNAVVELTPRLRLKSWFAPSTWLRDNINDSDLGSTAPVLLPGGLVFIAGKSSEGYLLAAGHLGGVGHPLQGVGLCQAYGGSAYAGGYLIVPCPFAGATVAFRLAGGSLAQAWRSTVATGPPSIAGGVAWSVANGTLVGLSMVSGAVVDSVAAPETEHFAAPSIGGGLVVVAGAAQVTAYRH